MVVVEGSLDDDDGIVTFAFDAAGAEGSVDHVFEDGLDAKPVRRIASDQDWSKQKRVVVVVSVISGLPQVEFVLESD